MAICSSGVSQLKAGKAASVVVDSQFVQSLLPPALAWLYPYLPFMHGLQIEDTATFCSIDPPTFSVPTAVEFFGFVTGNNLAHVIAVNQFLQDVTQAFLWYNLCECASVATPAPPTAPSPPAGLPDINPPDVVSPLPGAGCGTYEATAPVTQQTFSTYLIGIENTAQRITVPLPAGATRAVITCDVSGPQTGVNGAIHFDFLTYSPTTPFVDAYQTAPLQTGTSNTATRTITAGTNAFVIQCGPGSVSYANTNTAHVLVTFYCGTLPGATTSPCCPPDPVLSGKIEQLYQLLTIIQRQIAPFAYVSGATHSALTGTGTVSVSGILGLLANCSVPSSASLFGGTPDVRRPIGRINLATADGYTDRWELVTDSQLILPRAAGIFTDVGYSLEPGVTLTLTELIREP